MNKIFYWLWLTQFYQGTYTKSSKMTAKMEKQFFLNDWHTFGKKLCFLILAFILDFSICLWFGNTYLKFFQKYERDRIKIKLSSIKVFYSNSILDAILDFWNIKLSYNIFCFGFLHQCSKLIGLLTFSFCSRVNFSQFRIFFVKLKYIKNPI